MHSHQFPKLRLKFKQNLISLAGGMTRLPVTDPKVASQQPLCSTHATARLLLWGIAVRYNVCSAA